MTNASTTGLLDARTGDWAAELVDAARAARRRCCRRSSSRASHSGALTPQVAAERPGWTTGAPRDRRRLARHRVGRRRRPGARPDRFAYISCGTWSLVGVELDAPVLTEASRRANFTNERGVDGTVRYLRNVMGLWLLQESLRTWELRGPDVDLARAARAAAAACPPAARDRPGRPGVPAARRHARADRASLPRDRPPVRSADAARTSSAASSTASPPPTRRAVADAERLSGTRVDVVHLVGGGARNALLCQLTADASGLPVLAGPVEATALGNVLVQARAPGAVAGRPRRAARSRASRHPPPPLRTPDTT